MKNFRKPAPLRVGDSIHIVAPSGPFDKPLFLQGLALIERAGFAPVYGDGIYERFRYLAGGDERRLAELQVAIGSQAVRAIWTARGGYGATRLLPRLAAEPENAPWLIGFSDATALHARWGTSGLQSIHAANVDRFSQWTEEARHELFSLLRGDVLTTTYQGRVARPGGDVSGPIVGGNLTVLAAMCGTNQLPDFSGCLVMLEDVTEAPYRLDRVLTQLIQSGVFAGVLGFVLGQFTRCEGVDVDYKAIDVVVDVLGELDRPILSVLPFGHDNDARPVVFGAQGVMDMNKGTLTVG